MGRELNVVNFIREHPDWEELLRAEPYCITTRWGVGKYAGLVLLKYTQFGSDFTNPIVKECRGLILDTYADYQVVSYGFNKFLNAGEPGADEIDWSTARVQDKQDGCFSPSALITLSSGESLRIKAIYDKVKKGETVEVLSYNFDKQQLVKRKVVNVFRQASSKEEWVTLTINGANCLKEGAPPIGVGHRKSHCSKGKNRRTAVTKNHIYFVKSGDKIVERRVDELQEGDIVYTHFFEPTSIGKQILLGSLLGDGSCTGLFTGRGRDQHIYNYGLTITHSPAQKDYLLFKASFLIPEFDGHIESSYVENSYGKEKVKYISRTSSAITKYAKMVYDNKKDKRITREVLNNLDWFGFAIWYMDDGSISKGCKNNSIHLHTERYPKEDITLLSTFFNERGYKNYIRTYRGYYMINFSTEASEKIWGKIRGFILPSMQYKLPERHQGYFQELVNTEKPQEILYEIKILKKEEGLHLLQDTVPWCKNEKQQVYKYDLEIEGQHNYFCNGILVHNSNLRLSWWKRGNDWLWSTLSSINAWDNKLSSFGSNFASFPTSVAVQSYAGMCMSLLIDKGVSPANLSHDHTYIFELCTPYNRVVVEYDKPKLYHIGTRDNLTFEEINVDIGVEKPKEYPLHSLSAVLDAAEALNKNGEEVSKEGFVVVDANWRRVKVKSPLYLIKFHAVTTSLSLKNTLEIRLRGEQNEVISCFAESKPAFDALENLLDRMCKLLDEGYKKCCEEAKEQGDLPYYFVRAVKPKNWSGYYFWKRNHPDGTAMQFLLGGYILPDGRTTPPVVSIRDKVKYYWANRDNEEVWHVY